MSTTSDNPYLSSELASQDLVHPDEQNAQQYRSVSKAAVVSIVFAILGGLAFIAPVFVLLPILGTAFGLLALGNFRRFAGELVGKPIAQIGFWVSAILMLSSIGMHSYIYATEVPEGYQRISFSQLRPRTSEKTKFSERALEFDGQQVFLKGYVRLNDQKTELKNFILVGDFGDCCFGGNPDISDIVAISIKTDDTVDHSYSLRRIGGKFRVNKRPIMSPEKDIPQVIYEIEADYVK